MKKIAIVIQTHFYNDAMRALFERLHREAPEEYDIFLLVNLGTEPRVAPEGSESLGEALHLCNDESLLALDYPMKCKREGWSLPGNEDLIFLSFFETHRDYDFYWGVEYDVHYQGDWGFFFRHFAESTAGLIGTTMYEAYRTPKKVLLPLLAPASGETPAPEDVIRGLYPTFRLSGEAARAISDGYRRGWSGHYELVWGTLVRRAGLEIEDFGGVGTFTKAHNRNRFYFNTRSTYTLSPGTFVFRPNFTQVMPRENTLWHPVKPNGHIRQWHALKVDGSLPKRLLEDIKPRIWRNIIRLWFLTRWQGG